MRRQQQEYKPPDDGGPLWSADGGCGVHESAWRLRDEGRSDPHARSIRTAPPRIRREKKRGDEADDEGTAEEERVLLLEGPSRS